MADLCVKIAGVALKNPVITASGTFGFGREYNALYPLSRLGGISCKGTTLHERLGNPPPRIAETPSGILNSVGLHWLKEQGTVVIANLAGSAISDYCQAAEKLDETAVDMIELNISCPNVNQGGASFGTACASAQEITAAVRKVTRKPLIVKLTPNVTSISDIAAAVEEAGADAVSLINTLTGMRINIETRRPVLRNNTGGMSGPAVFPVAVRMVWETARRVKIPVIGMGGIASWEDAVEMMLAGASAIQVGTAMFADAYAPLKMIEGIERYLEEHQIQSVTELTGKVEVW